MKVAVFSAKPYDIEFLEAANEDHGHELVFLEPRLTAETVTLADGYPAVCVFVNDRIDVRVVRSLAGQGTDVIATRSAGFNHIDLDAAAEVDIRVMRVPAYSPYAVAEHAVGLILALNRRIYRSYQRVREGNFALHGLLGYDLHGRTVGVIGTGTIGKVFCRIMGGFGCEILAHDPYPNADVESLGVTYVPLEDLFSRSHIVSLHCPLTPDTHHLIDADVLEEMRDGVTLINTSRGALVDTVAAIEAIKSGRIGALGIDVYEEEEELFFRDLSDQVINDDVFARLLTFPNVLVTGHQAFFTEEALAHIAETTLGNLTAFERGDVENLHEVTADRVRT